MATQDERWRKAYLVDLRDALIRFLSEQDYSGQDIADLFGINRSTVSRILDGDEPTLRIVNDPRATTYKKKLRNK